MTAPIVDPGAVPDMGKTSSEILASTQGRAIGWSEVVAFVPDDGPPRALVVGALRSGGFSPDAFAHGRTAREAVLEGLVRAEDLLELTRGPLAAAHWGRVRAVRRRLELELWP